MFYKVIGIILLGRRYSVGGIFYLVSIVVSQLSCIQLQHSFLFCGLRQPVSLHPVLWMAVRILHKCVRALKQYIYCWPAVWLSGNALALINVVALRQTRLVPRWVTICGRVNHLGM